MKKQGISGALYFVIADGVRVFRGGEESSDPSVRPHLVEVHVEDSPSEDSGNEPRDRSGRFEKGDSASYRSGLVGGENHSRNDEMDRRRDLTVSRKIEEILDDLDYPEWHIVAPANRLASILTHLSSPANAGLQSQHKGNWFKLKLADIESRLL